MILKVKYPLEYTVTSEEWLSFITYLFIYYRITGLSQRLSRKLYSKLLLTAGPAICSDQGAQDCVHSGVANAQGVPLCSAWESFSLHPAWTSHFTSGPLSLGPALCSTVKPWLPLLNHLLMDAESTPRLDQPCFFTSLHRKNVLFPMLQRLPLNLLQFVHVFPTEVPAEGSIYTWSDECWAEMPCNLVPVLLLI